ncbi:MAG: PEP-CTERM sorting domain-containing protein, partial [Candidatus Thiodiazotropha sp.]
GSASRTSSDNSIEYLSDTSGNYYGWYSSDYFYSSLLMSSHPLLSEYIPFDLSNDYIDSNIGVSIVSEYTYTLGGVPYVGYDYSGELHLVDSLDIQNQNEVVQNWVVGDHVQGFYSYGDTLAGTGGSFHTRLTLTNITPAPVPLPETIWLFGSGLIGLVRFARQMHSPVSNGFYWDCA